MFVDEAEIQVLSGKGGDGMVHFRKEKFVNRGGPDGGDGGRGGDIIFSVNPHLNTLYTFQHNRLYFAENGKKGGPKNQTGKSGESLIIDVPPGTIIYERETERVLADLTGEGQQVVLCSGGRGGRGNARFANSRHQAPRMAERGEPGTELELHLELKLIADIGIIGMPNAGKSSMLAAVTNAKPKIADYPFTTLVPNLGVAILSDDVSLVLADIPGLIEGAHSGVGLGDTFLKHIQRTKVLIHVLDGSSTDAMADFSQINTELSLFDPKLGEKPQIVVLNKMDMPGMDGKYKELKKQFKKMKLELFSCSTVTHQNLKEILWQAYHLVESIPEKTSVLEMPVYRAEVDEKAYTVEQTPEGYMIKGVAIERAAEMTYWDNFESIRRFQRILQALGITDALREIGVDEGDVVQIGSYELEWSEQFDDYE
ncbi:MAG TPA: GTPase ObgE [Anaerolineaceae bacterium]|uniref:GTPase Obg n=1 Tax=Anaerolinea thermophila TaxID=167964 RepID=A0A101FYX4_9CHLR|nr:MAG: GTPase obg [Anaerolinea thermophila]HAF62757.1 GTPase ObgE [Anaerolineaceae bacterium]